MYTMGHMGISGVGPSLVTPCQIKYSKILNRNVQILPNQAEVKSDGVINLQNLIPGFYYAL